MERINRHGAAIVVACRIIRAGLNRPASQKEDTMLKGQTIRFKRNAAREVWALVDVECFEGGVVSPQKVRELCAAEMGCPWSLKTFTDWCLGLPSAFDSAAFLYNGTPWDWLARLYETNAEELQDVMRHVSRSAAEQRCILAAFRVFDND